MLGHTSATAKNGRHGHTLSHTFRLHANAIWRHTMTILRYSEILVKNQKLPILAYSTCIWCPHWWWPNWNFADVFAGTPDLWQTDRHMATAIRPIMRQHNVTRQNGTSLLEKYIREQIQKIPHTTRPLLLPWCSTVNSPSINVLIPQNKKSICNNYTHSDNNYANIIINDQNMCKWV